LSKLLTEQCQRLFIHSIYYLSKDEQPFFIKKYYRKIKNFKFFNFSLRSWSSLP